MLNYFDPKARVTCKDSTRAVFFFFFEQPGLLKFGIFALLFVFIFYYKERCLYNFFKNKSINTRGYIKINGGSCR